jgi:hypothetical protein
MKKEKRETRNEKWKMLMVHEKKKPSKNMKKHKRLQSTFCREKERNTTPIEEENPAQWGKHQFAMPTCPAYKQEKTIRRGEKEKSPKDKGRLLRKDTNLPHSL